MIACQVQQHERCVNTSKVYIQQSNRKAKDCFLRWGTLDQEFGDQILNFNNVNNKMNLSNERRLYRLLVHEFPLLQIGI